MSGTGEPKLFNQEKFILVQMLRDGHTFREIAEKLDRNNASLCKAAKRLGVRSVRGPHGKLLEKPRRKRGDGPPGRPGQPDDVKDIVIKLRRERPGMSIKAMSEHIGLSREIITRILVQAGMHPPRRSRLRRGEDVLAA